MILFVKQLVVDTPLSGLGERLRWVAGAPRRMRHPELWDLYLEPRRTQRALESLIEPTDVCVDVGAHIGSVLAELRRLAPRGSHVAFEPVPVKAGWLRKKFDDVRVIEAATSDECGTAEFFESSDVSGFSGLRSPMMGGTVATYTVKLVTIDEELADLDRIDFLKIDVEGNELPTLRGASTILTRDTPKLLFECGTDPQLESFGYTRADLFAFLSEHGYSVYSVADFVYGCAPMDSASFVKAGTYPFRGFNYFAVPHGHGLERLL